MDNKVLQLHWITVEDYANITLTRWGREEEISME